MNKPQHKQGRPALGHGPVYEIRTALGLSQRDLADRVGCARRTIQYCEEHGTMPQSRAVRHNLESLQRKIR